MVRVAVVGCCHGELDDLYATVRFINEMDASNPIRLIICCGDFQAVRNQNDLQSLACPPKYRHIQSFHEYFTGQKQAPALTIFVGGNHESSLFLKEIPYGGFVAPNIFFLGLAGVIRVGGLRIAGLSGIYKHHDYTCGHFEYLQPHLDNQTMRSIYHVRELQVYQLSHLGKLLNGSNQQPVDVFLSHDWPRGIEQFGDLATLLRQKPFFQREIQSNTLGSPPNELLLYQLRPRFYFAAHLHVKFAAIVNHEEPSSARTVASTRGDGGSTSTAMETTDDNGAEVQVSQEQQEQQQKTEDLEAESPSKQRHATKFLALDKVLPRREFLQVLDIPVAQDQDQDLDNQSALEIMLDPEWLAILRATHHLVSTERHGVRVPEEEMTLEPSDLEWINTRIAAFSQQKQLHKPGAWMQEFIPTASAFGQVPDATSHTGGNPQTDALLELLELPHVITRPFGGGVVSSVVQPAEVEEDPNAIDIDLDEEDEQQDKKAQESKEDAETKSKEMQSATERIEPMAVMDSNEIDIDLDE